MTATSAQRSAQDTSTRNHGRSRDSSLGRSLGIVGAAVLGWVVGFYAGVFVVLSLVGFNRLEGWQFELATVSLGALGATLAASFAARDAARAFPRVLTATLAAAAAVLAFLAFIQADFAIAIIAGGIVVAGVAATTAILTSKG